MLFGNLDKLRKYIYLDSIGYHNCKGIRIDFEDKEEVIPCSNYIKGEICMNCCKKTSDIV